MISLHFPLRKASFLLFFLVFGFFISCNKEKPPEIVSKPKPPEHVSKPKPPGFYVKGRFLYDVNDQKTVLIGPNLMASQVHRDGTAFKEIAKTGANSVRIGVQLTDSPAEIDFWITKCIEEGMIPMLNECSHVAYWPFWGAVQWYTSPGMLEVIKKHESYLLINIVDEAGASSTTYTEFEDEYKKAIDTMRAAGIKVPLIIDGLFWGQDIDVLQEKAKVLLSHDPLENLMFNLTLYSEWDDPNKIREELRESVEMKLPLLCGEWSWKWYQCGCCVAWETLIEECHKYQIGQMPWSWGPGNSDCPEMDMTADGTLECLSTWGKQIALDHVYSIKHTSVKHTSIFQTKD